MRQPGSYDFNISDEVAKLRRRVTRSGGIGRRTKFGEGCEWKRSH